MSFSFLNAMFKLTKTTLPMCYNVLMLTTIKQNKILVELHFLTETTTTIAISIMYMLSPVYCVLCKLVIDSHIYE